MANSDKPATADRPQVKGIDAIMIYAEDPQALSAWYATHLGISTSREKDGNFYGEVSDEKAGKSIHLGIYGEETGRDPRAVMVNYRVDDLDAFLASLEEKGIEVEEVVEESYGRFAHFRDGEGNRIEVWSPRSLSQKIAEAVF